MTLAQNYKQLIFLLELICDEINIEGMDIGFRTTDGRRIIFKKKHTSGPYYRVPKSRFFIEDEYNKLQEEAWDKVHGKGSWKRGIKEKNNH